MRVKILGVLVVLAISFLPLPAARACIVSDCTTTCTGPTGVECCCFYQCRSGGTWVCNPGYCGNTDTSCL